MIDIHTHLYWKDFDEDQDDVILRATMGGVTRMISVGTDLVTSRQAIEVAAAHDGIWASVGIHPHDADESRIKNQESPTPQSRGLDSSPRAGERGWIDTLRELARHPKVVAIGECGLDYFVRSEQGTVSREQKERQKEVFLAQIAIAKELDLPIIIHTRPSAGTMDAYEDVREILLTTHYSLSAVLHCYQGDTEITRRFLELPNVYFSFAGNITYPVKQSLVGTKDDLGETVKLVPLDRLFTETDCPFLSPQAKRGERNEPDFVRFTAEKVAGLHGTDMTAIEEATERNFRQVFTKAVVS